jgi:stage V sporulation protein G
LISGESGIGLRSNNIGPITGRQLGGCVEITEVRITLRGEDKLRGFANVTFDHAFVVRGLKIICGVRGLFVSMPSRRRPDGTYQDVAHPINIDMRKRLENAIIDAYEKEVQKSADGQIEQHEN